MNEAFSTGTGGAHLLLIEDDSGVAQLLCEVFGDSGYRTSVANTGAEARRLAEADSPDLILLDLGLPDADGLVLCADLHSRVDAPIIICSATNDKRDSILAFKLGADDFVAKPFDLEHLLARVEASLRRAAQRRPVPQALPALTAAVPASAAPLRVVQVPAEGMLPSAAAGMTPARQAESRVERVGELVVDHARRQVTVGGALVPVTPTEYRILTALMSRPDEVISRDELAMEVWGYQDAGIGRSIDVHMRRLRLKLQSAPAAPPAIVSVRGFGYKLTPEEGALVAA